MHENLNLQRSSGMEMYSGSMTVDGWGVGCNTSSPPVSVPGPPNYPSCPKKAGMHVRGHAYIRSKRLGKNDVTHKEAKYMSVYVSML